MKKVVELYEKYKEIIMYLIFGVLAFIVSMVTFWLFNVVFSINELAANVISWIITVTFAFFTNRVWVFEAKTETAIDFLKQLVRFFGGRIFTLVVEEAMLGVFVTWLGMNSMIIKFIAQFVVIVLNYIISKLIVFKE